MLDFSNIYSVIRTPVKLTASEVPFNLYWLNRAVKLMGCLRLERRLVKSTIR
jgi:hypothetical protein